MENLALRKSSEISTSKTFSGTDKSAVGAALAACLTVQKTYGKTATDLESIVRVFLVVLEGYSAEDIVVALQVWLKTEREFPTPSDLIILLPELAAFQNEEGKINDRLLVLRNYVDSSAQAERSRLEERLSEIQGRAQ